MRFLFYATAIGLAALDIATLAEVGRWIGTWPTLGMVLLSAIIGVLLVRTQGITILTQARGTLSRGSFPAREVFDGVCVLIGGGLLALPGFASDLLGMILLAPPARRLLGGLLQSRLRRAGRLATWPVERKPTGGFGAGPVIEGEYESGEAVDSREATTSEDEDQRPAPSDRLTSGP